MAQMESPDTPPAPSVEAGLRAAITLDELSERLARPVWCGGAGALFAHGDRREQEQQLAELIAVLERLGISWSLSPYKDARSMGALFPRADAPWMRFAQRTCGRWDFWDAFQGAARSVDALARTFDTPVTPALRRRLQHRLLANEQLVLAERLRGILEGIPFEELLTYPESFRLAACESWTGVLDVVRRYTGAPRP
jgi:hypothetical protein